MENPRWPDPELLATDHRNVIDHFKYWDNEAIRAVLDEVRHPFGVVLENFAQDFNVATSVRNANAFLAREVWITGRKRYDRRGAMGTYHYQHVLHAEDSVAPIERYRAEGYQVVCVDNLDGAADIHRHTWAEHTLMIFGQEQIGVSPDALARADHVLYIPQYGSTRSINVGVASGIAMNAWCAQWGRPNAWSQPQNGPLSRAVP